jgi:DNA-binding MarR family transcriptional regulator
MRADSEVPSGVEIAVLLRRAQLRKQMACEAALAQVNMTLPQWGMLHAVATQPDSSTHALALSTGQSDQSAGAVVARLEQRGLLERRPGAGKAILHRITPEGKDLVGRSDAIVAEVMGRLIAGIPERDLRALRSSLDAIAAAGLPAAATGWAAGDLTGLSGNRSARRS